MWKGVQGSKENDTYKLVFVNALFRRGLFLCVQICEASLRVAGPSVCLSVPRKR